MTTLPLTFLSLSRYTVTLSARANETIGEIKERLRQLRELSQFESFALVSKGYTLVDNQTVSDYQLQSLYYVFIIPSSGSSVESLFSVMQGAASSPAVGTAGAPEMRTFPAPLPPLRNGEYHLLIACLQSIFSADISVMEAIIVFRNEEKRQRAGSQQLEVRNIPGVHGSNSMQSAPLHIIEENNTALEAVQMSCYEAALDAVEMTEAYMKWIKENVNVREVIRELASRPHLIPVKLQSILSMDGAPLLIPVLIMKLKEKNYSPIFQMLKQVFQQYGSPTPNELTTFDSAVGNWRSIISKTGGDPSGNEGSSDAQGIFSAEENLSAGRLLVFGESLGINPDDIIMRWVQNSLNELDTAFEMLSFLNSRNAQS